MSHIAASPLHKPKAGESSRGWEWGWEGDQRGRDPASGGRVPTPGGRRLPDPSRPQAFGSPRQEQTPLFLAAREGAVEVAQLLLEIGAARGLRDQAGLAPADVARQRSHWDLLTLLEGAGPITQEARSHARNTPGGGAAPRCRTLSAGARPRGGGACLQARTWSVDLGARRGAVYARCRSRSGGSGGPSMRGRRLSADSRGRRGARVSQDDWPRDWVALEACGSACSAPIPPPSLTPSPERGSPQVSWGLPVHQEVPLNSGGRNQN